MFHKNKKKISTESLKEGQKGVKQNKMATSPCQEASHAKQETDIIGTLHIMMEEIKALQEGQKNMAVQISQQIDNRIKDRPFRDLHKE